LTAGVLPAFPPDGTTKTWNEGPEAGAGEHRNAQPMLHVPLPTVNAELVQLPCVCGVGPRRTCAVPTAAVVLGTVAGGDVAPEVAGGWVVALEAPVAGAVVADPCAGGRA